MADLPVNEWLHVYYALDLTSNELLLDCLGEDSIAFEYFSQILLVRTDYTGLFIHEYYCCVLTELTIIFFCSLLFIELQGWNI